MLVMPLFFAYISFTFPSGAVFYWVIGSIIGIIQQYFTSGWGSLANYLKFLPPEKERTPHPVLTREVDTTATSTSGEIAVSQPRLGFWDVLQPLTEQGAAEGGEGASDAATEDAIAAARSQNRAAEMRRHRRRR
jgi:YidC/Oxa1 family membrane protein insertase